MIVLDTNNLDREASQNDDSRESQNTKRDGAKFTLPQGQGVSKKKGKRMPYQRGETFETRKRGFNKPCGQ